MSEKMDGIRAYWNGDRLISKHNKDIICPSWFLGSFPKGIKLDGELWISREGSLESILSALRSLESHLWKEMRLWVFDVILENEPYEN